MNTSFTYNLWNVSSFEQIEVDVDVVYTNISTVDEYIFDRPDVRALFIILYSIVFCCCFFGNLMVILVVILIRRLRSTTNFFLANLAVADLCVGIFCVFQNLTIYLIPTWLFGDFLCKMYQFVHSLSYTASIFILVVICTERYFAIMHPITCKQILTPTRLRLAIILVWLTSAIYSAPRFVYVQTVTNDLRNGETETICISHRKKYNSELFDIINFVLLYLSPLSVMSVLYSIIAVRLWNSSNDFVRPKKKLTLETISPCSCQQSTLTTLSSKSPSLDFANYEVSERHCPMLHQISHQKSPDSEGSVMALNNSTRNILRARRGVIRMLIIVVLTFAICNLPFHARKMWQYWSSGYQGDSTFSSLFTPLTFLITFINSAVNPMLYAFLSKNFRKAIQELLCCSIARRSKYSFKLRRNSSFMGKSYSVQES